MTKRDLIDEVLKQFSRFSRRDAEVMVNTVFDSMTTALTKGERIEIRGFGSFVVKQRQARGNNRFPGPWQGGWSAPVACARRRR